MVNIGFFAFVLSAFLVESHIVQVYAFQAPIVILSVFQPIPCECLSEL